MKIGQRLRGALHRLTRPLATAGGETTPSGKPDFRASYLSHVDELSKAHGGAAIAMELAVGGQFKAFGVMQRCLVRQAGLPQDGYLVEIGCGSGRLASALARNWPGRYLGIDVVPALLQHARKITSRQDWQFMEAAGTTLPERDAVADMVVSFSVFTHLLHEETYCYLRDARRVLKPGGRIVFSFLEFAIPSHWAVFEQMIASASRPGHLNQFISREGIQAWARKLGLEVVQFWDGDKPHITLDERVVMDDGRVFEGLGNMGQSVCVLRKPTDT